MDTLSTCATRLEELGLRCTDLWNVIHLFRGVAHHGLKPSQEAVGKSAEVMLGKLDVPSRMIFERISPGFTQGVISETVKQSDLTSRASVDSASLVFAHSVLDDLATECCRVSAVADPGSWRRAIRDKKIRVEDLAAQTADDLVSGILAEYLDQLGKEALSKRLDLLNANCQPAPAWSFAAQEYRFDRERIERLDRERQSVIHRVQIEQARSGIEEDLAFLKATCFYLVFLVANKYDLDVDPIRHAFDVLQGSTDDPIALTHRSLVLTASLANEIADSETVHVYSGRIYVSDRANKQLRQLPVLLPVVAPSLSPDGQSVVYVRPRLIRRSEGDEVLQEIWISGIDGSDARLVLQSGPCADISMPRGHIRNELTGVSYPQFDFDGANILFFASVWATSAGIFSLSLATREVRFFTDGNSLEVIRTGPYSRHFLVSKHRYWQFEPDYDEQDPNAKFGAYDHLWLVSPTAETLKDLGDDLATALKAVS